MRGLPQKQNARRADKIRLCGHLRRYKKIVKKIYIIFIKLLAEYSPTSQAEKAKLSVIDDLSISDVNINKSKTIGDYKTEVVYFTPFYESADGNTFGLVKPLTIENKEFAIKDTDKLVTKGSYFLTISYNK